MAKLHEICRSVRSKNAGPYWITLDIFFADLATFERYAGSAALEIPNIASLLGVDGHAIKRFLVPNLLVLKISFLRNSPQGGSMERDMHGGQYYVRLLDLEL
jgi:hypothetical protein